LEQLEVFALTLQQQPCFFPQVLLFVQGLTRRER
jgi:hypothetical protein